MARDDRGEVREFLISRRGRISPASAGLPVYGTHRRVSGLRREEVAMLAGVSVDYYTRLERGNLRGVSDGVLEAVASALQLDEAEHVHLFNLARAQNSGPVARRARPASRVRPVVQRILDAMTGVPAFVRTARLDMLATNALGRTLHSPLFDSATTGPSGTPNTARFTFLDPAAREYYPEWEKVASDGVAILRAEAGRTPYDRALSDLIGELSTRSEEFRVRWASHDVRLHRTGTKRLHHPVVGDLTLAYEVMQLTADPELTFVAYSPEPGSASEDALRLLASWAATRPGSTDAHPDGAAPDRVHDG